MAAKFEKLNPVRFGLACGLTCAIGALFLGIMASYFDWGSAIVAILGSFYLGYDATFPGAFLGAGWAIAEGFLFGWLFAWFYNKL
ncbi:MAG: bacteriophage holin [Candidatus Peribacteraceae bacterium]|nr:bacteriophage holin [Candidatus Peribacteraceae bacterium]